MQKKILITGLILVFLAGAAIKLYPQFSEWLVKRQAAETISSYEENEAELSETETEKIRREAQNYNMELARMADPWTDSGKERLSYEEMLDPNGNGIMGYVEIPKIGTKLPIYHGSDETVLQTAIGHLEGSSLPVGGSGTHCVISGHRGLPSAKLFTELDELVAGDRFLLHVLDETYVYEVDQIAVTEPDDLSKLMIEPGQDLCTLVTCTPYGVNSHRLLVRGHRVEGTSQALEDAQRIDTQTVAFFLAIPFVLLAIIVMIIRKIRA